MAPGLVKASETMKRLKEKRADMKAKTGLKTIMMSKDEIDAVLARLRKQRQQFHSNKMGAGVVVEVASDFDHVEMLPTFRLLFKFGTRLRSRVTGNSKVAESCAVGLALLSLFEVLHIRSTQQPLTWTPHCRPQPRTEYGRICWRAIEDLLDSL